MLTKYIASFILLSVTVASAAQISRIKTFSDGEVLNASDLNAEFNNTVDAINGLNNDNIISGAGISPSKISGIIKGAGISRNSTTGELSASVDNSSIEISGDQLRVKSDIAGSGLVGGSGTALSINADNSTLEVSSDVVRIKDGGVTQAKRASLGHQISSSCGVFSTASSADVTNLSISITTTGRPVFIGLIHDGTSNPGIACASINTAGGAETRLYFYRNLTAISTEDIYSYVTGTSISGNTICIPASSFWTIDTPIAGTFTYKVKIGVVAGTQASISRAKLIAYEL